MHRSGKCIVAGIGARDAAKEILRVSKIVGIPARVAHASGKIQVLPVIGLQADLLGRRIRTGSAVVEVTETRAARWTDISRTRRKPSKGVAAGLVRTRVAGPPIYDGVGSVKRHLDCARRGGSFFFFLP